MKPPDWYDCPGVFLEDFLWDCDISFDLFDSSKAERIHEILCFNQARAEIFQPKVDEAWKNLSEEDFQAHCRRIKMRLEHDIQALNSYLT